MLLIRYYLGSQAYSGLGLEKRNLQFEKRNRCSTDIGWKWHNPGGEVYRVDFDPSLRKATFVLFRENGSKMKNYALWMPHVQG